jgi:hypothetical protein
MVNEDIAAIEGWVAYNGLRLNAGKTKAVLLGSARFVNAIPSTSIALYLDGGLIELTDTVRNLGLNLASTLNWGCQVRSVSSKVNGVLWRLKYCKGGLSLPLRVRLITSLAFPLLDYCAGVLTDLTGQQRLKLKRLLNTCVRFIFDLRRDEHVSPWFERLGWLSADDRREYLICSLIFSIIQSGSPPFLACNFQPSSRPLPHLRFTSSSSNLAIPSCRITTYQRSFHSSGCAMWNSIPSSIREENSLKSFKRLLFDHLRRRGGGGPQSVQSLHSQA